MSNCSRRRKYKSRLRDNCTNTKLNILNEIFNLQKSRLMKSRGTWRIVPKDSIEVHKDRQREEDTERKRKERNNEDSKSRNRRNRNSKKNNSRNRKVTGRHRKYNLRKSDAESSLTSFSSVTSATTISSTISSCSCVDCF